MGPEYPPIYCHHCRGFFDPDGVRREGDDTVCECRCGAVFVLKPNLGGAYWVPRGSVGENRGGLPRQPADPLLAQRIERLSAELERVGLLFHDLQAYRGQLDGELEERYGDGLDEALQGLQRTLVALIDDRAGLQRKLQEVPQ